MEQIKLIRKEPNRKPNTICDVCQTPIYRRPNVLLKNKTKCCSHTCQNKLWKEHFVITSSGKNPKKAVYGENNGYWKGGITYKRPKGNYTGVKYVKCPDEYLQMARKDGYIMEHRLVMAKHLNRLLTRTEVVHHIDHNPANNNIENLMLFENNSLHKKYEAKARIEYVKGSGLFKPEINQNE